MPATSGLDIAGLRIAVKSQLQAVVGHLSGRGPRVAPTSYMATYVSLMKFTDQGIRNFKDTVARAEKYWATIKEMGGRVVQQVWTTGEFDIVTMFEAPDDETAAALAVQANALGNVRMTTTRGFTGDEVKKIIAKTAR